ncbi:MAG: helicase-related protein [Candidatus Neomarinimicrobiota bacterium]
MTKRRSYAEPDASITKAWGVSDEPIPGLRDQSWPRFIEGPDPRVLSDLYIPALKSAVRYDRCCAYFSSSVLAAAARGFAALTRNLLMQGDTIQKPTIRLLVNEQMSAADAQVLEKKGDLTALEKTLLKRFKTPREALEKDRLAMLAWMLSKGMLEIKVGIMRYTGGINHAKYGYVTDPAGDILLYRGSGNETAQALSQNYEQFEISVSWLDEDAVAHYRTEFDRIWRGKHPSVAVVDLPTGLRQRLLKLLPDEPPITEPMKKNLDLPRLAMKWMFVAHAPYFSNGNGLAADALVPIDLWPHQRRVVDETVEAWPEGRLLCDEVGMGKTIEAIMIIRRLMAGRGVGHVLILVPAGLVKQWQEEFREKGGMMVPFLKGDELVQPDGSKARVGIAEALEQPILMMSREMARKDRTKSYILNGPVWDLVLMDEAHASRRAERDKGGFNTGNLLLTLLRDFQLSRQARSTILLSATPMQLDPWEPWDLLCVLGLGGYWASGFKLIEDFYDAIRTLRTRGLGNGQARRIARLMKKVSPLLPHPLNRLSDHPAMDEISRLLRSGVSSIREANRKWLESNSPLRKFVHRNNRDTLRRYYEAGLIEKPPPERKVDDLEYDYARGSGERAIYQHIKRYIDERYENLEAQKPGKGFVMTTYRRRMSSSPSALAESFRKRIARLDRVIRRQSLVRELEEDEKPDDRDWGDAGREEEVDPALPDTADEARQEKQQIEPLIRQLQDLGDTDSKRDFFRDQIRKIIADGRSVLVFTSYLDTMDYLRRQLRPIYHESLACYSGRGGEIWDGSQWKKVEKSAITKLLDEKKIRVLLCNDAASEGLNLQAAGALINYDMPWNPSRVEQRIGRIDRFGQDHPILPIVNIYLRNSVDTRVYRVLRERCGLFERFVGPMQPILNYARTILEGERKAVIEAGLAEIQAHSDKIEDDEVLQEIYRESGTDAGGPKDEQVLARGQVESCIRELMSSGDPGLSAFRGTSDVVRIKVPGLRGTIGLTSEALDINPEAYSLDMVVDHLANHLQSKHPVMPLVVGIAEKGAFRVDVCLWVRKDRKTKRIHRFDELNKLLMMWDGYRPSPEVYHEATVKAQKLARRELRSRIQRADRTSAQLQKDQLEAGKARLKRELGLNLYVRHKPKPLPVAFADTIRQADHRRFRKAYNVLQDMNCWEELDQEEIREQAEVLTANERKALHTYRNIDVALDDPRIRSRS